MSCPEDWDLLPPHPSASLTLEPEDGLVLHLGPDSLGPPYLDAARSRGGTETVQALGRVIVATTDLGGYWHRIRQGRGTSQFADVFPPSSEASLVELTPAIGDRGHTHPRIAPTGILYQRLSRIEPFDDPPLT